MKLLCHLLQNYGIACTLPHGQPRFPSTLPLCIVVSVRNPALTFFMEGDLAHASSHGVSRHDSHEGGSHAR